MLCFTNLNLVKEFYALKYNPQFNYSYQGSILERCIHLDKKKNENEREEEITSKRMLLISARKYLAVKYT